MAQVNIEEKGCRGCSLCVDICPVDVFELDGVLAKVKRTEDCIGCFSCFYLCPSQCLTVTDTEIMRPFHRVEKNTALVEKFLQEKPASKTMGDADFQEALKDVGVRLDALAHAVTETMGRGQKAAGRKAGVMAAAHLPEMYEEVGVENLLKRMQERFKHCFDFDYKVSGDEIELTMHPCGLNDVVKNTGGKVGEATLCDIFHEYWAGMISTFAGTMYRCTVPQAGASCQLKLAPSGK